MNKLFRKARRAFLKEDPDYYDMYENRGERYFARLYLHLIQRRLHEENLKPPLRILDAGCQAGRMAIPMAEEGHQVTGLDTSDFALWRARRHAKERGVSLNLIRADLTQWLPVQPQGIFDVVVCTEVLYLRSNHRQLLAGLLRLLKSGGLCFISHRPPSYYLAEAFQRKDWEAVKLLLSAEEGKLNGSYYNWQNASELERLYREHGVKPLSIEPVGFLSWLAVNPETLDETGQDLLFQAEANPIERPPGLGRYLLVCGKKP